MHAWKHWLMGAGFFGFGTYKLFEGGSPWLVGLCVVASGYLFYRALTDQTGAAAEDLEAEVIILGGGPAGLAAAVYGGSEGMRTFVAES